jgi:S-(hydroxymethyl)glutathione dehydrogenase / alcohol dehydrogenase
MWQGWAKKGVYFASCHRIKWSMDGKINIDDLIAHEMPLDDINTAFDLMHAGTSIRSVVTF